MRSLPILTLLLLCACSPQAPDGSKAPPPADYGGQATAADERRAAAEVATMDVSQPMVARGNEPFWAVKMTGTQFTLSRPGQPDTVFSAPGAEIVPGRSVWRAKAADGRTMVLTLYMSDCSDGMSDVRYPMAAEVELLGERLGGCAAKASELPKPRPAG